MGEDIFGAIVMMLCGFGCGGLFYGIGAWALKSEKPVGFWANGPQIKGEDVTDLPAYNRENARMWKLYSIPYFLLGFLGFGVPWNDGCAIAALVILVLAATLGTWWLIRSYKRIRDRYKTR